MLKPLQINTGQIKAGAQTGHNDVIVRDVFRALHGFYGTLFTAKYATGQVDAAGKDKGILSARMVWGYELRRFDRQTVGCAIDACKNAHPEYPPMNGEIVVTPTIKHYPPDTAAATLWLKNRQPNVWRDKVETALTGPDGGPIQSRIAVEFVSSPARQEDDE